MYVPEELLQLFRTAEQACGPMPAASAADFLKTMWDDYRSDRDRSGRLPALEYEYIFSHMLQAADNGATMAQILGQCSSEPRGEPPFGPLNPEPRGEPLLDRILQQAPGSDPRGGDRRGRGVRL